MTRSADRDLAVWREHRPRLLSLAYRMLGDLARAEDVLQDAWLRWHGRSEDAVADARAYLAAIVARLCLNELGSARARREESRSDRLPEPVDVRDTGLDASAALDELSMALLVVLQQLTPPERAVLLLHDVFDFRHAEIAALVGKSEPACRKLLERARESIAVERRRLTVSREEHARLLAAFVDAATRGDVQTLTTLLTEDAVLVADGGAAGRSVAGIRNLPGPLHGRDRIAAFVCATTRRAGAMLVPELRELNAQPALVLHDDGRPFAALLLAVADGRITRVWFQADPARLERLVRGGARGDDED